VRHRREGHPVTCDVCGRVFDTPHGMLTHRGRYHDTPVICQLDGCDRPTFRRGYCQAHYRRLARHGDVGAAAIEERGREGCDVPGCDRPHQALGLCNAHYMQQYRRGRTTRTINGYRPRTVCQVCGSTQVKARDLCRLHYDRRYKQGRRRLARRGPWWRVVCDYLEVRGPVSSAVLVEIVQERHGDAKPDTVRTSLMRLRDAGFTERGDDGRWRVIDPGWVERATL